MLWLAVVATALCAALLQPLNIRVMTRLAAIDQPNARSSHAVPTPRGGGVTVVIAALLGLSVYGVPAPLLLAIGLFALIGLVEDVRGTPVRIRLGLQVLAAAAVALAIVQPAGASALLVLVAVVIWLTGFTNVFNFMDGVNGISAVHVGLAGLGYSTLGLITDVPWLTGAGLVLAVAGAGFLPWNAWRARVFLGDVGSYGLGAALGVLAVYAVTADAPWETALAPLAVYLADTTWTLARRLRAGESLLSAHRSHVYQRLAGQGWSHQRVSAACGVLTIAVMALTAASHTGATTLRILTDLAALGLLAAYLAAPTVLPRHRPVPAPARRSAPTRPDR